MIEFVDISHAAELDAFVAAHSNCHFMQTSAYGRFRSDRVWTGIICRNHSREIRGTMAVLQNTTRRLKTSMLYAPRGPIFEHDDLATFSELVSGAQQLARDCGAYMIRLDPMVDAADAAFLHSTEQLGFRRNAATDLSLSQPRMCYVTDLMPNGVPFTPETLLAFYSRMKRYDVRRAQRRGVTIRYGSVEDVPAFCRMMNETAEKRGFAAHSDAFFRRFLTELGEGARMFVAEKDGEPIAATITMELGNRMWHMYGCSDRRYHENCPNELLQYAMQCHALEIGCRWFDFRGVDGYPVEENPNYGLHHYKQGFGAVFCEYAGEFDLITRPIIEKLMRLVQHLG